MAVKKRLGEMLLEAGVIDETQLHAALGHQRKWGGKLGQALLDLKLATEPQIVSALSRKFGYESVHLSSLARTPALEAALRLVPRELALRQTLLPIASDTSSVTVAMGDPSNIAVVDELSFRTGKRVRVVLAGDREIQAAVKRLYFEDEAPQRAAITLDEPSGDGSLETVRDPFAAMPDHIREGYFNRPAHTIAVEAAPRSAAPPPPVAAPPAPPPRAPPPLPPQRAAPSGGMVLPPAPAARAAPRADVLPSFTPPPVLGRAPATVPFPAPPPPALDVELLGEPILATELAPDEDQGPFEGPHPVRPRDAALLDALDRAARGEESPLLKPAQLVAALARLLVKRGVVTEKELLEALTRK